MTGVVFDCNVYIQALLSRGPAHRCFLAARDRVRLWCSEPILLEVIDVLSRPDIRQKHLTLTDHAVWAFVDEIRRTATVEVVVPRVFPLPRDPDDEMYLNLAINAQATFIVSRDSHLLDLMDRDDANSKLFRSAFPDIEILRPEPFLARLDATS